MEDAFRSRSLASAVVLLMSFGLACSGMNQQGQQPELFQFERDDRGRLVRLNTATGEVVVYDGTRLILVHPGEESAGNQTSSPDSSTASEAPASTVP
ncbi:MAG: hypothetical protein AB7F99_06395 [Vicinamibacterales bacterium]